MGTSGSPGYRGRERERQRRQPTQRTTTKARSEPAAADVHGAERRTAATACGWCGGWEQGRAAASGLSAVKVVERRVEVPVPLAPSRRDWPSLLGELARQLNDGRVYDRDLPGLARALEPVVQAHRRRAP